LTAVVPGHGPSTWSTAVSVSGAGFLIDGAGPNTVLFGALPALNVSVVDDGTLTCQVAPQAAGSVVGVSVANSNGQALLPAAFTFDASPVPVLTGLAPASGLDSGGTTATLSAS